MPGGMPTLSNPNLPENINNPFDRRLRALEDQMRGLMSTPQRVLDIAVLRQALSNVAINGVLTSVINMTMTRPAWANAALVIASFSYQVSNSSGAGLLMGGSCAVAGNALDTVQQSVPNASTGVVNCPGPALTTLTGLTGNVLIEGKAQVSPGTNNTNALVLNASVIWLGG